MKIAIPLSVPETERDAWCDAYRVGYLDLKHPRRFIDMDRTQQYLEERDRIRDHYPQAYTAGQVQAFRDLKAKVAR